MNDKQSDQQVNDQQASDLLTSLAKPAQRALAGAGYTRLEQLSQVTEAEVLQLHGMGPKALATLRQALADRSLSFEDQSN